MLATAAPEWLRQEHPWNGLQSLVQIHSQRQIGDQVTQETRYYISSLSPDAGTISQAVRSHWGIENSVHWILDVEFLEDRARARRDHEAQNLAAIRHLALNLIKAETTRKISVKRKRYQAALDTKYLQTLIFGANNQD